MREGRGDDGANQVLECGRRCVIFDRATGEIATRAEFKCWLNSLHVRKKYLPRARISLKLFGIRSFGRQKEVEKKLNHRIPCTCNPAIRRGSDKASWFRGARWSFSGVGSGGGGESAM